MQGPLSGLGRRKERGEICREIRLHGIRQSDGKFHICRTRPRAPEEAGEAVESGARERADRQTDGAGYTSGTRGNRNGRRGRQSRHGIFLHGEGKLYYGMCGCRGMSRSGKKRRRTTGRGLVLSVRHALSLSLSRPMCPMRRLKTDSRARCIVGRTTRTHESPRGHTSQVSTKSIDRRPSRGRALTSRPGHPWQTREGWKIISSCHTARLL